MKTVAVNLAKKRFFYCYGCLSKHEKTMSESALLCPSCQQEMREIKCGSRRRSRRTRNAVVTMLARKRGIANPSKKSEYDRYLQSPAWKKIRSQVLERDNHKCRICHKTAVQVLHTEYSVDVFLGMKNESLVSLCRRCHRSIHHIGGKKCSLKEANRQLDGKIKLCILRRSEQSFGISRRKGPRGKEVSPRVRRRDRE